MDGISVADEIIKINPRAKVLILSNLDEDKYREKAMNVGAIGLLNKQKTEQILELIASCDNE